jgi:hypothetical protein
MILRVFELLKLIVAMDLNDWVLILISLQVRHFLLDSSYQSPATLSLNLSPEGVTLRSTIPLLWSKLQESCKTKFAYRLNKSAYFL